MNEMRQTGGVAITDVPADGSIYDDITFRKCVGVAGGEIAWSGNTIHYFLGGANSDQLLRQEGDGIRVIATDIKTLEFVRETSTPDILEVNLEAEKNTPRGRTLNQSLNFELKLRD